MASPVSSQLTDSNASYFPGPFHLHQSLATQYATPYVAASAASPAVQIPSAPFIPLRHRSLVCILCHNVSRRSSYFKGMRR
ncbi:hypothetical protein QN277_021964 [Acacia crassicarpa]|uniref:Uncharacterized protein n=1 Tax=Acacia crassicarpa TaxID=499986 RepID=A0AAE1JN62_9FABA|nr:hypothetical protein QN277_021964 [Acacia crassicarpa]